VLRAVIYPPKIAYQQPNLLIPGLSDIGKCKRWFQSGPMLGQAGYQKLHSEI
jgi:hypothetical protein